MLLLLRGLIVTGILSLGPRRCDIAVGSRLQMSLSQMPPFTNPAQPGFLVTCYLHGGVGMEITHRIGSGCHGMDEEVSSDRGPQWMGNREQRGRQLLLA